MSTAEALSDEDLAALAKEFMTAPDVAGACEHLGISRGRLYAAIRAGELESFVWNGRRRFTRNALDSYVVRQARMQFNANRRAAAAAKAFAAPHFDDED